MATNTAHLSGARRHFSAKPVLFLAFAFAVMADPVSSVAYAIEAALRALNGHLALLVPTMGLVIGIIALVTLNYSQLVASFPQGGGSPEAAGRAFGEPWSFLPIGALVVDFALTIAISIAAAGSALIAYAPALAAYRIPIALGLLVGVAGLTWFGHGGRLPLWADDDLLHRHRDLDACGGLHGPELDPRACTNHRLGLTGARRGHPGLSGRDGPGNRNRGTRDLHSPAWTAWGPRQEPVWSGHPWP